jgi:hypothetical protein
VVSDKGGEAVLIRPNSFGLRPLSLSLIALPVVLFYSAWANTNTNHPSLVATLVLGTGALAMWVLTYRWRARVIANSIDGTLEIRGRLISQTIHVRNIRSAVLYGPGYNQAVTYLDRHDRRLLTLRLAYWSLADIKRVNDRLGILLNEWEKPKESPPGKGLLSFMERHPNWVGVWMALLMISAPFVAVGMWIWLSH